MNGAIRRQSMEREDQQDATIRCLLLTSVSTCFGLHYAHLQENKGPVTAFGVLPHSQESTTCPYPSQLNPLLSPSHC